jgi:hypothetical protein
MPAIIVDPDAYVKETAFTLAQDLCCEFLDANGLTHPEFIPTKGPIEGQWKNFGMYEAATQRVWVNLRKSRVPTKTPGFSWSFTGYKSDLTAPGILAHEVSHHVHRLLRNRASIATVRLAFAGESAVSGYEPHPGEAFAEAGRLFILNPELLRAGRPKRWTFLTSLGLKPCHVTPWRDVLMHAHPKIVAAAETWITRSK